MELRGASVNCGGGAADGTSKLRSSISSGTAVPETALPPVTVKYAICGVGVLIDSSVSAAAPTVAVAVAPAMGLPFTSQPCNVVTCPPAG